MGYIVLPDQETAVWHEDFAGSISLSSIVEDFQCIDYTDKYRLMMAKALLGLKLHLRDEQKNSLVQSLHKMSRYKEAKELLAELSENFRGLGHDA